MSPPPVALPLRPYRQPDDLVVKDDLEPDNAADLEIGETGLARDPIGRFSTRFRALSL